MPLKASLKAIWTHLNCIAKDLLNYLFCYKHTFNSTLLFPKHFEAADGIKHDTQNRHNTEAKLKVL